MDSIQVTDQQSEDVAIAPRVRLEDIQNAIYSTRYATADKLFQSDDPPLKILTICCVVMKNGFVVIGKAAPASPENFNADLGRKFAYEDAIRQLWPLMGFALKDRLAQA